MISKEEFTEFITNYQIFDAAVNRLEKAISGSNGKVYLFESDWYEAVGKMLDIFINSHFTDEGGDWINYYLFEDIEDKLVTITKPKDMFNEEYKEEYHLNSIDELWNFLLSDIKCYFKNV